jgi:hypothetical protein
MSFLRLDDAGTHSLPPETTLVEGYDTFRVLRERVFAIVVEHAFGFKRCVRTYVLDLGRQVL